MKLNKLKLTNFKGAVEQALTFGGKSALITGENGSGKSRNIDAICWLLTGKDSFGSADFDIKPMKQGEDGGSVVDRGSNDDKQIECPVEAEFSRSDGTIFTLKRRYKENWVRKSGTDKPEYRGNTTDYFIDGVPNTKKDYDLFVEKEFGQEQFIRVLLNPLFFNEQTKDAKERREILFAAFGNMTDEEIVANSKELTPLVNRLEGRTVEGFQKMMAAIKKETVSEFDLLTANKTEAYKSVIGGLDAEQVAQAISDCDIKISHLTDQLNALGKDSGKAKLFDILVDKKRERERLQIAFDNSVEDVANKYRRQHESDLSTAAQVVSDIEREKKSAMEDRQEFDGKVSHLATERTSKLARYAELNESTFTADTTCPTCSQEFPASYIDEMRGNWNEQKSNNLSKLVANGKAVTVELDAAERSVGKNKIILLELEERLKAATTNLQGVRDCYTPYTPSEVEQTAHSATVAACDKEIADFEKQIAEFGTDDSVATQKAELQGKINVHESIKATHQQTIAQIEVNKLSENRIAEYSDRQKELGLIRDDADLMLNLCNLFTRTKAGAISDNINKHFKIVSFQLFRENETNDGLQEVCETVVDGKTYSRASLNKALRVAANIDITTTFGKKLGKQLPIFLDDVEGTFNRYSVDTGDAQVITLMAVEKGELEVVLSES